MALGSIKRKRKSFLSFETLAQLQALPARQRNWGEEYTVYNDGANNGTYRLVYNLADTDKANNSNFLLQLKVMRFATLAELYALPGTERVWNVAYTVYNDGANDGDYTLVYNEVDTDITNNNNFVRLKFELQIGVWNMDTNAAAAVNHGLAGTRWQKIKSISVIIIRDDGALRSDILRSGAGDISFSSTQILLSRAAASVFDDPTYSSAVINRGYITIEMTL